MRRKKQFYEKEREILQELSHKLDKGFVIKNFYLFNKIKKVMQYAEEQKAIPTVLLTLALKKISTPKQNITKHMKKLRGGFNARSLDTKVITPFLQKRDFICMKESGWTTRSLAQPYPYSKKYNFNFKSKELGPLFLDLIEDMNKLSIDPNNVALYILYLLKKEKRNRPQADRTPIKELSIISIRDILYYFQKHREDVVISGKARIPVLQVYSALSFCEQKINHKNSETFLEKKLSHHNSSDSSSNKQGDIHRFCKKTKEATQIFEIKDRELSIQDIDYIISNKVNEISNHIIINFLTTHEVSAELIDHCRKVSNEKIEVLVEEVDRFILNILANLPVPPVKTILFL